MAALKGVSKYGQPMAFSATPDMDARVRELAYRLDESVSDVLRAAVDEGLSRVAATRLTPRAYAAWSGAE